MTNNEYLKMVQQSELDEDKVRKITDIYSDKLPEIVKKIISCSESGGFLDDELRILSYAEVVNAENDLHVPFKELGIVPLFDSGDNDFIVFDYTNNIWAKFNIVDKILFKKRHSLEELLL